MSGTAELEVMSIEDVLRVPQTATHPIAEGGWAVWLHRDGHAVEQPVELGLSDGTHVEIRTGLAADDEVIVTGQSRVSEGSPVVVRSPL
jgi:multidrug efflux system membrane fusion protein